MLINDNQAVQRLNSPMNLINQIAARAANSVGPRQSAMGLFGVRSGAPQVQPNANNTSGSPSPETPASIQAKSLPSPIESSEAKSTKTSFNSGDSIASGSITPRDSAEQSSEIREPISGEIVTDPFAVADALANRLAAASLSPAPQEPEPTIGDLLTNAEAEIRLGTAHDAALALLVSATNTLKREVDLNNIKPDKLPSVISAAAKTVEGIRRERNEQAKGNKEREVHLHFYTPVQKQLADYGEVIEVT